VNDASKVLQHDENVSESEKEHLQKHYELLWAASDNSVLSQSSLSVSNFDRDSASVDYLSEFDLLPIIEESTRKTKNFISVISKQLKEQQIYSNGRSPSISINQYSLARSRLNSQNQKLSRVGSSKGSSLFTQKDISPSRSCSPRKDFQENSIGSGYSSSSSYNTGQSSNIYMGGNVGSTGGDIKLRDPLLLPVLGTAAFIRQNKLHNYHRPYKPKGFRSPAKSSDFSLIYGTSSSGLEAVMVNRTNSNNHKLASTSDKFSVTENSDLVSTKSLRSSYRPASPVSQSLGAAVHSQRQLAPIATRSYKNSYIADDRSSKRSHYHLMGFK